MTTTTPKYIRYANAVYRLAEALVVVRKPLSGKYDDTVGEWLHNRVADGMSTESITDAGGFGVYDLLTFDEPVQVKDKTGDWTFMAAVLAEDGRGFVVYRPFDSVEEARAKWAKLEQEYSKFEAGVR